jgi:hypothetical protein
MFTESDLLCSSPNRHWFHLLLTKHFHFSFAVGFLDFFFLVIKKNDIIIVSTQCPFENKIYGFIMSLKLDYFHFGK